MRSHAASGQVASIRRVPWSLPLCRGEARITMTAPIEDRTPGSNMEGFVLADDEVKLRYTDMDAQKGKTSYYYVRIEQADGNLAWASPVWITYKP